MVNTHKFLIPQNIIRLNFALTEKLTLGRSQMWP